eukprot:395106-Pelagomonas_calceolata.AAC.1
MRYATGKAPQTSTANHVRQPHQVSANQRNVYLFEMKYCGDARPGQQLETAQRQQAGPYAYLSIPLSSLNN